MMAKTKKTKAKEGKTKTPEEVAAEKQWDTSQETNPLPSSGSEEASGDKPPEAQQGQVVEEPPKKQVATKKTARKRTVAMKKTGGKPTKDRKRKASSEASPGQETEASEVTIKKRLRSGGKVEATSSAGAPPVPAASAGPTPPVDPPQIVSLSMHEGVANPDEEVESVLTRQHWASLTERIYQDPTTPSPRMSPATRERADPDTVEPPTVGESGHSFVGKFSSSEENDIGY
jgi:hypothetical protein